MGGMGGVVAIVCLYCTKNRGLGVCSSPSLNWIAKSDSYLVERLNLTLCNTLWKKLMKNVGMTCCEAMLHSIGLSLLFPSNSIVLIALLRKEGQVQWTILRRSSLLLVHWEERRIFHMSYPNKTQISAPLSPGRQRHIFNPDNNLIVI